MTKIKKRRGRPVKEISEQNFKDTDLYRLLVNNLGSPYVRVEVEPNYGVLDTLRMAIDIGVSRFTVYRFLNDQRLTKRTFQGLVRISKGKIKSVDLLPFLMN